MDAILLCGGPIEENFALQIMDEIHPQYIIGIDKGLEFCYHHKIHPDYILGDFDSIEPEILEYYEQHLEIPVKKYKPEKDATDTKIGLELAIKLGSHRVFLLGATGGRLDHFMGNLQGLIAARREAVEAWILDEHNAMTVLDQSYKIKKQLQFGKYISFFSLGDCVKSLTLTGFKYSLQQYDLMNFDGICVSNEIQNEKAQIEFEDGYLLMVMSKDIDNFFL